MSYYIKCPFFMAHKENTITCEGCMHFFDTKKKHRKQIEKCEEGGTECRYAKKLFECYEIYQDSPDLELRLHEVYADEMRNQISTLVWRLAREKNNQSKLKENYESALEIKTKDINRLTRQLMLDRKKVAINEKTILALMYENNLSMKDIGELVDKYRDSELIFNTESGKVEKR